MLQPDAAVQARIVGEASLPYDIHELQAHLNGKNQPDISHGRVVSLLLANSSESPKGYLGISWVTQNLSPWAGGQTPFEEKLPNRAGFKLLEALQAFQIRLRPEDHALDLGAAPGAWTMVLRRHSMNVTAVAPTPMYYWLQDDPCIQIFPMTAESYLPLCRTTFDLLTNDMILDAQDSARLMVDFASHLRSEGIAIMTLKLREHNRRRVMDHAFRILRKAYKIIHVRQLVNNRQEVTLFLRKHK